MSLLALDIQIISAPSILGLKPAGVEDLGESLLAQGLAATLSSVHPVIHLPAPNHLYSTHRDTETHCINTIPLRDFSLALQEMMSVILHKGHFPVVLGGDCSILLGIATSLKKRGTYGILFMDAHADFYEPEKSTTGEAADMDLAIITGNGPEILSDIDNLSPYIKEQNTVHIGQRDAEEARQYGSRDIRQTAIMCIDLAEIRNKGILAISTGIRQYVRRLDVDGWWIHFDTDVLADEVNPAVDYRLPGGLSFAEAERLVCDFLSTGRVAGMSVTIFNPRLDKDGHIAKGLAASLGRMFNGIP